MGARIEKISQREMQKRFGVSGEHVNAATRGGVIYVTNNTTKHQIEHEKAHIKLGHKAADLTPYQYADRELAAEKEARSKEGRVITPKFVNEMARAADVNFSRGKLSDKEYKRLHGMVSQGVNKALKKNRLPFQIS